MGGVEAVHNGKWFENITNLTIRFAKNNINVEGFGRVLHQNEFYKKLGIKWGNFLSKKIVPDEVFVNDYNKTVYIIEKKHQMREGSNDEKLYACLAKKLQYEKMISTCLGYKVVMIYLLNDWFNKPKYEDTFEFMDSVKCKHFFNEIPFEELGIVA